MTDEFLAQRKIEMDVEARTRRSRQKRGQIAGPGGNADIKVEGIELLMQKAIEQPRREDAAHRAAFDVQRRALPWPSNDHPLFMLMSADVLMMVIDDADVRDGSR